MQVQARHAGGQLPFERDRRLVLRRLPVGSTVTRATLTLTPLSTDPERRFLETLSFPPGSVAGDRGATKVVVPGSVEVNLHARRRLASMVGSTLTGGTLLVDLGGGFLGVDAVGGFGPGAGFPLTSSTELPGLTVTGLRVAQAGSPDLSVVRVSSPPSNVTVAVEGGPVFFTHLGDLVEPVSTPDVADVLQAMLPDLDTENGCCVLPFLLHSDSIARLDVELDLEFAVVADAAPDGLRTVQAPYRFGGAPVGDAGRLAVRVPAGMVAVEGATTGRVQGAFAATRVVHGAVTGQVPPELVTVDAGHALAQPFVTTTTEVVSSLDVLLTAVTADVTLAVDVVDDLDGKPGRGSLLARPGEVTLTRDTAGSPTWVNVPLRGEVEVVAGRRQWLVVQARAGSAAWSAGGPPAAEPAAAGSAPATTAGAGPALQQTRDGGLSWRAIQPVGASAGAGMAAALRLRHTTTGFHLPLELRVGSGAAEVGVSLQQFAPSGAVDFGLGFPEVARAVNAAAAAVATSSGGGEQVANGDFADWYRVGSVARRAGGLSSGHGPGSTLGECVFTPDGARVLALGRDRPTSSDDTDLRGRLVAFDVLSREPVIDTLVGDGLPYSAAVDPTGRRLVAAVADVGVSEGTEVALALLDPSSGRRTGAPIDIPEPTVLLAAAADGRGIYLAGLARTGNGLRAVVRHADWTDLESAAGGAPLDWDALPHDDVPGLPLALAAGPGEQVVLLVAVPDADGDAVAERLHAYADRVSLTAGDGREADAVAGARGLACPGGRPEVLVLAPDRVRYVRADDLTTLTDVLLDGDAEGQAIAVDPDGSLAVIAGADGVAVLDVARHRIVSAPGVGVVTGEGQLRVAVSPAGTHAAVTRTDARDVELLTLGDALPAEWELTAGRVTPVALPATGEVMALLGRLPMRDQDRAGATVPEPAALSQSVPVVGGARYRFAFDGIALAEGASAQVRWRGDACTPERTDRVAVAVFDLDERTVLARVPRQEQALVAPPGATQAEVRFFTPDGLLLVDRVTLGGSADVSTPVWEPSAPTTSVTQSDTGVTLRNSGSTPAAVAQVVSVTPGDRFDLRVDAVASGEPGAAVELELTDESGAVVGEPIRVPLEILDLDAHAAEGDVPPGAVEATLRISMPPGAVVELAALSLTVGAATEVGLYFASEAPGDLSMTDVTVTLDEGTPPTVPLPAGGLCPPTPPGEGEDGAACYCQACGNRGPVTSPRAVRTDAGRPATVTPCPTCGTARVRAGGRATLRAQRVDLPRFRTLDRSIPAAEGSGRRPAAGPALVSRLRVDAPVTDVAYVGEIRAAQLRAAGVPDVVALARADVSVVAALPAVSDKLAATIIASAAELVRARGRRVVFD